jgi:hypothetical protein
VPDACNRLHAPRRGGAAAGLSELAGQMPNTVKDVVDNEMSKPLML